MHLRHLFPEAEEYFDVDDLDLESGLCELDIKDEGRVIPDFQALLDQQQCLEFQEAPLACIRSPSYCSSLISHRRCEDSNRPNTLRPSLKTCCPWNGSGLQTGAQALRPS